MPFGEMVFDQKTRNCRNIFFLKQRPIFLFLSVFLFSASEAIKVQKSEKSHIVIKDQSYIQFMAHRHLTKNHFIDTMLCCNSILLLQLLNIK